ncbi:MAG: hypothetical protein IJ416_05365 [Ruminiclostridium sp.]|nr:hypothetical protein [Ruminiclostridium sp.]
MKKLTAFICTAAVAATTLVVNASADEPYVGYNYDWWGDPIPSQNGFVVEDVVSGVDMDITSLAEPNDLFVHDETGKFYIVDSKNNRIIETDSEFTPENTRVITELTYSEAFPESESTIKKTTFSYPKGIYVRTDKDDHTLIYVADSTNERVVAFNTDLEIEMEYVRPSSDVYDAQVTFNPDKVVVDSAFNVYVVIPSITQGTVQFSADGTFNGYYGANRVNATAEVIAQQFWKLIYTREQIIAMRRNVSIEISNVDIDKEGFIYTVTESRTSDTDVLKKLNPAGTNIFTNLGYDEYTYGDAATRYYKGKNYANAICDVEVDQDGNIYLLDFATGRVFQYTNECDLLFIFGGLGTQKGTFTSVSAVESFNSKVYVLDSRKNNITVFGQTEFGGIVQNAIYLFNEGLYDEAKGPWEEVLRRDSNYWLAYIGLGNAYLNQGDYETALDYFYRNSRAGYNRAFKSFRIEFIRANFTWMMIAIIGIIVLLIVLSYVKKYKAKKAKKTGGTN